MCPICVANLAMMVVAATSSGGAAAILINKFRGRKKTKETTGVSKLEKLQIKEKAS